MLNKIPKKNPDIPNRIIDNDTILIDVKNEDILHFEKVSTFIWNNINGKNSLNDIVNIIVKNFDVKKNIAEKDLIEFIEILIQHNAVYFTTRHTKK